MSPAASMSYPPSISLEDLSQRLRAVPAGHPRLLAKAEDFARLRAATDPMTRTLRDAIGQGAAALATLPPVTYTKEGRRLLAQSRTALQRILTLAMAYQLTGEARHATRAQQEMLAAAAFPDWNPSHYLDVGEMTLALAIGYDWLYETLDEPTRATLRQVILSHGIRLPEGQPPGPHSHWIKAHNNWGQVCHGGMLAGALVLREHEPALAARTVHRAIHEVTHAMTAFAPHGSYPEGPMYWSYGTTYNVILIDLLETVLGSDFGLCQAPGFDRTGEYLSLVTGPSGKTFNYADGGSGRQVEPALLWFAGRFKRGDWASHEMAQLGQGAKALLARFAKGDHNRFMPLLLLWLAGAQDAPKDQRPPLHWSSQGATPITLHRSSWDDAKAVFVGLKGGSPSGPHGHMDIGSFVYDADGVRWAADLGAEGYHAIEARGLNLWTRDQHGDRWRIFRQSNLSHNTLVINDHLQIAANAGDFVRFSEQPTLPHSVLDMAKVYEGLATGAWRGVALLPSGRLLLRDRLTGLTPGAKVRWGMLTPGTPEWTPGATLTLRQGEATLALTAHLPAGVRWQGYESARPPNDFDSPNPGTVIVGFEVTAPADGILDLAILFTPGSRAAAPPETINLLADPLTWK